MTDWLFNWGQQKERVFRLRRRRRRRRILPPRRMDLGFRFSPSFSFSNFLFPPPPLISPLFDLFEIVISSVDERSRRKGNVWGRKRQEQESPIVVTIRGFHINTIRYFNTTLGSLGRSLHPQSHLSGSRGGSPSGPFYLLMFPRLCSLLWHNLPNILILILHWLLLSSSP